MWGEESEDVTAHFKAQADQAKSQHALQYPRYQYQPRKAWEKKRRMTTTKKGEAKKKGKEEEKKAEEAEAEAEATLVAKKKAAAAAASLVAVDDVGLVDDTPSPDTDAISEGCYMFARSRGWYV